MSAELEGFVYFGVMGIVFLTVVAFTILRMKKTRNFGTTLAQSTGLSFLLFALACLWWFYQASDGFSQVFGGLIYGVGFVISWLINTAVLFFMKKKM
jgi:multisubunit Na+/H+ antiporter MnhG subunit